MSQPPDSGLNAGGVAATTAQGSVVTAGDLSVPSGSSLSITGGSGEERTALLRTLGGLNAPTTGQVRLNGRLLTSTNGSTPAGVGYLSAEHALIGSLTAAENVGLPLLARGEPPPAT